MASNVITALNLRIGFDISEFETKNQDMRKALARTTTILRSMATPAEKLANDIAAVTMVAKEQEWEAQKLTDALEHLNRKYDLTGQYAREARQAQQELADAAKKVADEERKAAKSAEDLNKAMAKQEKAIAAAYLAEELGKIEAEERRVEKAAEDAARAMAKQEKAVAWAYVREELEKIESEERRIAKEAEDAAKAMAKQEKAIAWAYVREELEKIESEERQIAKAAEDAAKAMEKQEKAIAWAYVREELEKIEEEERAVAAATDRHTKALERVGLGASKYEKEINELYDDLKKGRVGLKQYQEQLQAIDEHYVDSPARIKAEKDQLDQLNNARQLSSQYIKREVDANKQYREVEKALRRLKQAKELTVQEYKASRDAAYQEIVVNKAVADSVRKLVDLHNQDAAASTKRIQAYMRVNSQLSKHRGATDSAAASLSGFISIYGMFAAARAGLRVAAEMEQAQMAITVLAGSADEGRKVFEEVRDFAAASPITFESAQKATTTLMQFGMSGQEAVEMLQMLGDASAGNSQRLEGLALAFAQSAAAGRLTGQETLQMVNQGFSPLQQMAEDMAKELGGLANDYFPGLKSAMEQGLISFDDVKNALSASTSEGGRFHGMMEAMSKTLTGSFNQMRDSINRMAFAISQALKPALIEATKLIKALVDNIMAMFQPADTLLGTFGQLLGISVLAAGAIGTLIEITKTFGLITKATNVLLVIRNALMNPVALIAGLGIAAVAIAGMSAATAKETAALEANAEATDGAANSATDYAKKLKAAAGAQASSVSALEQKYIDIMKPLSAQLYALRHSAEATRDHELSMQGLLRDQRENVLEVEREIARLKEKREIEEMFVDRAKRQLQTEKEINQALSTGMLTRKEAATKLLELEDKRLERIKELADAGKSIQEKYNPVAKVAQQIAEMNVLLATGNITQEQYFAERNKLLFDNIKKLDMTQPEAMEAGSAQAAQFMQKMVVDEAEQQINELKAQTLLQQASLQAQQETNRRLADLKPVQLIR